MGEGMNVHQAVKAYNETHGWPGESVRIGPYTCGLGKGRKKCKATHAYAEARLSVNHNKTHEMWVWDYIRPCDGHIGEYRFVKPSRG